MPTRAIKILLIAVQALWLMAVPFVPAQAKPAGSEPDARPEVIAAVPREWPPQYDTDSNGKPIGFAIDVIEAIAARAGLRITYKIFDSFLEIEKALDAGTADIVPNQGIIPERSAQYLFTAPVETFVISIFVRQNSTDIKGLEDLAGHRVAVVKGNAAVALIRARADIKPDIQLDPTTALFHLLSGRADAFVYPQPVVLAVARQAGVEDLIKVVGAPLLEIKRAIAVRKDKPELLATLDKAVEEFVGSQEYQRLYAKWYGIPKHFWTVKRVAWAMGSLVAGLVILFAWSRYRLLIRINRRIIASEGQFRGLIEGAVPGVLIHRDFKPLFANRSYARIFGYDGPDELLRQPSALDHVAPHERRRLMEFADARLQGKTVPEVYEFQGIRKDGTPIWLENRGRIVDWEGASAIQRTVVDITEKSRAEAALMARTRQQAVIAELGQRALKSPDVLGLMNTAVRLLAGLLDVEYCAVLELTPKNGELLLIAGVGWKPGVVGHAITAADSSSQGGFTLRSGEPVVVVDWRTETRFAAAPLLRDHAIVSGVSVIIGPVEWPYGVLSAHTPSSRAFTEDDVLVLKTVAIILASAISRNRVEEELRASEERLRGAVESLQEGFALFDADDRLVMANDVYRRINPFAQEFLDKGVTFEALIRANVESGLIADAIGREEEFIRERLAQHRTEERSIIRHHSNGQWYLIKETLTPEGGVAITFSDITDLKQTEETLRDSEQRFKDFTEAASDWYWEMDENLHFTEFGERRKKLMNLPLTENIGKTRWEVAGADPDHDAKWRDHRATLEAHEPFGDFEYERIDTKGRIIIVRVNGKPVFDAAGNFRGYRGTARNVTKQKTAEWAMRDSEERLRAMIEHTPNAIVIRDLKGIVTIANRTYCRWLGIDSEKIVGNSAYELLPKEIVGKVIDHERKTLEGRAIVEEERKVAFPDGVTRDIFVQKFPIFGASGDCVGVGTIIVDITARRREEKKFRALLQSAPDAMVIVDAKGRIQLINHQAELLFGYKPKELHGKKIECLLPSGFRKKHVQHRETLSIAPRSRPIGTGMELRGLAKDGREIPIEICLSPIPTEEGSLIAAAIRDVTGRKAAEQKLSEMQAELAHVSRISTMGEMAAGLAHELNQPLAAITNYAKGTIRRMKSGHGDPAALLPIMELVADQALRAGEIIRKIRGFMNRTEPQKAPIDLNITISEAITLMAGEINLAGIEIIVEIPESCPPVLADSIQIQQVLLNLIRNAVGAIHGDGVEYHRLEIGVAMKKGNAVEVYVKDDGPGIAPDIAEHVFDPFFTTKTDGLGMGLSISRTIIKGHDGEIWVTSNSGHGLTVHFTLPLGQEYKAEKEVADANA